MWNVARIVLTLIFCVYAVEIRADAVCQNLARNDVQTLWLEAHEKCENADNVSESAVLLEKDAKGRFKGQCLEDYISTLAHEFQTVLQRCGYKCSQAGQVAGEVSAEIFCATSEEIGRAAQLFDRLRDTPDMICGEFYRLGCESTFIVETQRNCPKYAKGTAFENYYPASSNGCCSYNPGN